MISVLLRKRCGASAVGQLIQSAGMALSRCNSSSSSTASALKTSRVLLRKRFGQHLLTNPDVVKGIVDLAKLTPTDRVFEIGPGTGNMTVHLLSSAGMVYAVELDPRMAATVRSRAEKEGSSEKFVCVNADFLQVPLPTFDALVANIPYQISSPVLTRIFAHRPLPRVAVIMFQEEFAERMVAKPGTSSYSRLSVNSALLCASAKIAIRVGRNQFRPPPKVDSAGVVFTPREPPAWLNFEQWDAFLKMIFSGKNKTLRAIFANKTNIKNLLRASGGKSGILRAAAKENCISGESAREGSLARQGFDESTASSTQKVGAIAAARMPPHLEMVDVLDVTEGGDDDEAGGEAGEGPPVSSPRSARRHVDVEESPETISRAKAALTGILKRVGAEETRANNGAVDHLLSVFKAVHDEEGWKFC
jgi:18S rRNA (adenine1779-N6/adenine1780-N6)-dimethyltransferase